MSNYWSDSIQHLEWMEHIFKRPAMYIWNKEEFGLHHIFQEVLDNSLDEALAWHATEVIVNLYKDNSISVEDNWRWIPVWWNTKSKIDSLELVTWTVNTSWKYTKWEDAAYKISWWLHWVWIKATNATSEFFECHSYSIATWEKEKKDWSIRYENRKVVWWVKDNWKTKEKWTYIHFKPSEEIFWKLKYKPDRIKEICNQQAYLLKGIKLIFNNENDWSVEEFFYEEWVKEYLSWILNWTELVIERPLEINLWKDENKWTFEWFDSILYFTKKWTKKIKEYKESFANNIETVSWWPHVNNYEKWILAAFKDFAISRWYKEKIVNNFLAKDILFNVFYIINVKIVEVEFVWQTKDKLANKEIWSPLKKAVYDSVYTELQKNPSEFEKIIDRAVILVENRLKADDFDYDDLIKDIQEATKVWNFSWKLKSCKDRKSKNKELYIVEWDSAAWHVAKWRNSNQAYLPLRWVPMNVEDKFDYELQKFSPRALMNEEYRSIISAFWWNILDEFDEKKFDYKWWVYIATDADPDWYFIFVLLLNAFFRFYWLEFVNKYVYLVRMPLYKITYNWKENLFYTESDKQAFMKWKEIQPKNIKRYKWLWEYNSKQFKEYALDKDTRSIIKLNWESFEDIEDKFYDLLWPDASLRREFLQEREVDFNTLDL